MQDLARQLIACETQAGKGSDPSDSPVLRVYEKLRGNLCTLVGTAGFESLAARALAVASSRVPGLSDVKIAPDGKLQGLGKGDPSTPDDNPSDQAAIIFISCLLELLLMFLGKALTMNLVRNVWSDSVCDKIDPRDGRKA